MGHDEALLQHEYARVDADMIFRILSPNYNPFATKNSRAEPQWITIPNTFNDFSWESYMDYRLGGFHVEYCPIELQIHSVMLSYAWDEGTKTLELDCLKSIKLFEDKRTS